MNPGQIKKILGYATRQRLRVLALAVFQVSLAVLIVSTFMDGVRGLSGVTPIPAPLEAILPWTPEDGGTTTPANTLSAPASEPRALRIPKLNIDASFETPLDLSNDGSVGVPKAYDTVGWYKYSPTPGELGPAIILGHVDSYKGAAVFFYLGQLVVGDTVEIERNDGSVAVFKVSGYERVAQNEFPTERVYGNIPYAGIRLITCSGTYDKKTNRYDRNLIVYGELSEVRYPENTQ
jgi:sortase (surface protein transpeptidase)